MTANNAPRVNDMTLFESDRIHVIPFNNHVDINERDLGLKDRLSLPESLSGILNWCIAGLERFNKEGLVPSGICLAATAAYQAESDKIHAFVTDCFITAEGEGVAGSTAYKVYQQWCQESGYQAEGKQALFRELRERKLMVDSATIKGKTQRNVLPDCGLAQNAGW